MHTKRRRNGTAPRTGHVPPLRPGTYADGVPLHEIHYICFKLILRPNHFRSRKSLLDVATLVRASADGLDVKFSLEDFKKEPVQVREVVFADTADYRLYNNAFILRRRILYEDGFPVGEPEIVFKFRHPDMQMAAETDVRPQILGDHQVKFKCQALPLTDKLGGIRLLYSHNVQFPRSNLGDHNDLLSMATMSTIFPALNRIRRDPNEKISLVSDTIIEEVLQDIGTLDFGKNTAAKVNVALWRTRGEHRPLISELAFQIKFNDRKELLADTMTRAENLFVALQYAAKDWIALDATKTGMVYRLHGNPPTSHE